MAPWPEQGNEPKAPDKNSNKCENIALEEEVKSRTESAENPDSSIQPNKPDQNLWSNCETGAESGQFHDLDEGQLKALLEEAIAYKSPKDRETKSDLFKELLQEAEADESDCSDETAAAAIASTGPSGGSRSHLSSSRLGGTKRRYGKRDVGVAERQRSGGSLQNLVHAFRGTSGRHARDHVTSLVSARQREGGSLPTNVNVQGVESEDVTHSTELVCNYTSRATLQVSEDPHHVDMAVPLPISLKQGSNALNGIEPPLQLHSSYKSVNSVMGPNSDTKMAVSGAAESATMLYPVQHVSFLSIPPQQIPPSLEADVNKHGKRSKQKQITVTGTTNSQKKSGFSQPEVSVGDYVDWPSFTPAKCFYSCPIDNWTRNGDLLFVNFQDMNRIALTKDGTGEKKTVDENGNALASNRLDTVTSDRKGKRRIKMKNYRNIVTAEKIEGHRGQDNIDSLIQYIESPSGNSVEQNKAGKTRQTNGPVSLVSKSARGVNKIRPKEDEGRKRRSKETKIHKCNSLEEISKTKLEDLTSPGSHSQEEAVRARPKKQVTLDDAQLSVRSLDDQSNQSALDDTFSSSSIKKKEDDIFDDVGSSENKKKKDKKLESLSDSVPGNEFHLVQKKQRRKKRQVNVPGRSNSSKVGSGGYYGGRGFSTHDRVERDGRSLYRYRHSTGAQENVHPRRKSASSVPPSDNSDCSDEGSVCSLPVSSTTPRPNVGKTSTSGGSTPQASYADIARSVTSPPRAACPVNLPRRSTPASTVPSSAASSGIGDEETSASPEPVVLCTKKDAMTDTNLDTFLPIEEYPPLKGPSSELLFVDYSLKRGRLNRESCVTLDETNVVKNNACQNIQKISHNNDSGSVLGGAVMKTSSSAPAMACSSPVTSNKRPPVILLDEDRVSPLSNSANGITFGFDINEQLLCDYNCSQSPSSAQADTSSSCYPSSVHDCSQSPSSMQTDSSSPSYTNSLHEKMVTFVSSNWSAVQKEFKEGLEKSSSASTSSKAKVLYYSGQ